MRLPSILEIKHTLDGRAKRFACHLLSGGGQHQRAVVLFVSDGPTHVHGVDLPPGTVTFGYFWCDRPYNAYHWMNARGETIGVYFNLSDRTLITDGVLEWRDLAVDVLTTPAGRVEVLDEDELRADAPADVRRSITDGKAAILGATAALLAEIEAQSRALRPLAFPGTAP
jgi:Protein of unknown function (DUF402)